MLQEDLTLMQKETNGREGGKEWDEKEVSYEGKRSVGGRKEVIVRKKEREDR